MSEASKTCLPPATEAGGRRMHPVEPAATRGDKYAIWLHFAQCDFNIKYVPGMRLQLFMSAENSSTCNMQNWDWQTVRTIVPLFWRFNQHRQHSMVVDEHQWECWI